MSALTRKTRTLAAACGVGLAAYVVTACSSAGNGGDDEFAGKESGGSGGATNGAQTVGDFTVAGSGTASSMGGSENCGETSSKAQPVPVNLFIMLDKSGSMDQNNKWPNVTQALIAFFQDPQSAGLKVALRMFPDNGCDENQCSIQVCSQPQVDIGPLTADPAPMDAQEQKLVQGVQAKSPGGNTPMYAALGGAELWAQNYTMAHPGEKVAVLLATDGEPNGCDENIGDIAALAKAANMPAGILTFVIGFQGSNQQQLDQIATAGGTMKSFLIGNGNAEMDLVAALKQIQGSVVSCSFQVPASNNGDPVDPTKVNVSYQSGMGPKQDLGEVMNAGACTAQSGGWYYDDNANPTTITLCPSTCAAVQADGMADVQILLGCKSKMIN